MLRDHIRLGWHGAIAYRTAFVHPSVDLTPKVVDEQRRFDRFAIRINRIRNSKPAFSARLILLHERLVCHGSPLHDHRPRALHQSPGRACCALYDRVEDRDQDGRCVT